MTGNGKIRIVCVVIDGDADTVIDKLAEVITNAVQGTKAIEVEPTPFSRPEDFHPSLKVLRRHRGEIK